MTTLDIVTHDPVEMLDITAQIQQVITASGLAAGAALLFVPHTTAAITINENADPDVVRDMLMEMKKIVPATDGYRHAEGNSAAHIQSSLFGVSAWIIVEAGRPVLGTWQGIYFCEFDGPRRRQLHIRILPA